MKTIPWMCECNSRNCSLETPVTSEVASLIRHGNYVLIVDGCKRGPEPDETLTKTCSGYKLYTSD